eukprot:6207922-Pleurochrysis_carterae.AAC.7
MNYFEIRISGPVDKMELLEYGVVLLQLQRNGSRTQITIWNRSTKTICIWRAVGSTRRPEQSSAKFYVYELPYHGPRIGDIRLIRIVHPPRTGYSILRN